MVTEVFTSALARASQANHLKNDSSPCLVLVHSALVLLHVKRAIKRVGHSRKKVEAALRRKK
jgi:hypothetical protein